MRVALVLGAGGPVGRAFHGGVLKALADGAGWDAREAGVIVGTSAGATSGALLRAGLSAHDLVERLHHAAPLYTGAKPPRGKWPGSPQYLKDIVRRPWQLRPGKLIAALMPEGGRCTSPLGAPFDAIYGDAWPARPLWIPAVHYDTGARVVFGHPDHPVVDVGTAVRASSAVPGVSTPVQALHHGRFVDGGVWSPTHLDLLIDDAPDLVLVVSPLSRFAPMKWLLRREMRRLAKLGIPVRAFEPDRTVMQAMGWNPLDHSVVPDVARVAYRAAREAIDTLPQSPLDPPLSPTAATTAPTSA